MVDIRFSIAASAMLRVPSASTLTSVSGGDDRFSVHTGTSVTVCDPDVAAVAARGEAAVAVGDAVAAAVGDVAAVAAGGEAAVAAEGETTVADGISLERLGAFGVYQANWGGRRKNAATAERVTQLESDVRYIRTVWN